MATAYYAWSRITVPDSTAKPGERKYAIIDCGDKVTKGLVGDDWDSLVSTGSIRSQPYPKDVRSDESPKRALLRMANEAMEAALKPFDEQDNPDLSEDVVLYDKEAEE